VNNQSDHVGARLALARALMAREDEALAAAELARVTKGSEVPAEAFVLEGSLRLKRGDTSGARAALERALQVDPTSREALATLTAMDVMRRDLASARRRVDAALDRAADDPQLLVLAAKVALAAGEHGSAERSLRRAIALDPTEITGFALLARLLHVQQRLQAVGQEFEAESRRDPTNLSAELMAAVAVHSRGDLPEAERRYEAILKKNPRAALAANNLAAIFIARGENLDRAEQLALSAAEQVPGQPDILDTLGTLYMKQTRYGLAIRYFQQAVASDPGKALLHYQLGLAYAKGAEAERARASFRKALALNPRLRAAQDALATQVFLERPPTGRRQPIGRPRHPPSERLLALHVTRLLELSGVHAQVAVGCPGQRLELGECHGVRDGECGKDRQPHTIVDDAIQSLGEGLSLCVTCAPRRALLCAKTCRIRACHRSSRF
jgi:tetratricopeptide (TPR) repeat protein